MMTETILVTGASGFIGSAIVQEAIKRRFGTWAGIRPKSSKKYLNTHKLHFLELDFAHPNKLRGQLSGHKGTYNKFDYVIHCAGVTRSAGYKTFDFVNYMQTKYFVDTLVSLNMVPKQFIYISSLSIFGPIHEGDSAPISAEDIPYPDTYYGISKLKAELYMQSIPGFPYVIYRPTGVYGPRETDYYLLARSIKYRIDFSVGFAPQHLSFIYINDLVEAIFLGIEKEASRRIYNLSDGKSYSSREFSRYLREALEVSFVFHVKCPLFILKSISLLADLIGQRSDRPPLLNSDKYRIMKQRNWRCDIEPAREELGFSPKYALEDGVKETIAWYKNEGWL